MVGPRCSAGWARAEFGAELMLVFGLGKVAACPSACRKYEAPAFVEEDRLVKHLEKFRARLVIVTMMILLCASARIISMTCSESFDESPRSAHQKGKRRPIDHVEPDVEPFRSPPLSVFLTGLPTMLSRRSFNRAR